MNTTDKFKLQLEEWGHTLQQRADVGNGDIDGVLRLISDGESTPNRLLVLLSEFTYDPPPKPNPTISGERVVIGYSANNAQNGANFFQRLRRWEQYFKQSGATNVCALDLNSVTESTLSMCLQQEQAQ